MAQENVSTVAENGKGNGVAAELPKFSLLKPHLIVEAPHAADAVSFYKSVFGAEEIAKSLHPKRKADQELPLILHAHLKFGSAEIMVCDETEEAGAKVKSPVSLDGTSVILHLETDNVDLAFKRAVDGGATVSEEISVRSWGQRYGKVKDPYGFVWSLAEPIKASPVAESDGQAKV